MIFGARGFTGNPSRRTFARSANARRELLILPRTRAVARCACQSPSCELGARWREIDARRRAQCPEAVSCVHASARSESRRSRGLNGMIVSTANASHQSSADAPRRCQRLLQLGFVMTLVLSGALSSLACGASPPLNPCGTVPDPPAVYAHVIWIWMENHTFDEVIGHGDAPFTTQLAKQCGVAKGYATVGNPSLPNYIGATAGGTFGISDDDAPAKHALESDNLFRQVRASGRTAKSYEESMPQNCALTDTGSYAVKHNPAAYFTGGDDRDACKRDNVPMGTTDAGAFVADLTNDTLPAFSFVTPNLCHDTHDCGVASGDTWLHAWLPKILGSREYLDRNTAVFIVYDESTPIPNVMVSPSTRPGTVADGPFNHYSLLRTTEEMLGISPLLGAAADAPSMRSAFHM
jgi:hypothetical protein